MGKNKNRKWGVKLEKSLKEIEKLNLKEIRWKLTDPENGLGWSKKKAKEAEEGYRKYLILAAKYPNEVLVPTMHIDEVWHNHVLHTKMYRDDCMNMFGEMLHHNPRKTPSSKESKEIHKNFTKTIKLFEKEFGVVSPPGAMAFCLDQRDCDGKCDNF